MKVIIDEVDGAFYSDVVITPQDIIKIKQNEIVEAHTTFRRRNIYCGLRLHGIWDEEEEENAT